MAETLAHLSVGLSGYSFDLANGTGFTMLPMVGDLSDILAFFQSTVSLQASHRYPLPYDIFVRTFKLLRKLLIPPSFREIITTSLIMPPVGGPF